MASVLFRTRSARNGRPLRRRNDSDEEYPTLDWSKEPKCNLREILSNIVLKDGVSKGQKLGYLNYFTKFCTKVEDMTPGTVGFTLDEIFCCLRVSLFHDSMDVRAAGLRAMRYLLRNEESVESLFRINLEYLICRSLDVMLENKMERIQGLRLVRKLLSLSPKRFPTCVTRCLVAIARDGYQERDPLARSSMATVAELLLLNPTLCADCGGVSAILDSILQGNQSHQISEALIGSVLYLLNSPNYRYLLRADQDLQHFIAPFTDSHFSLPSFTAPKGAQGNENYMETAEQREAKFSAAKNALISVLRSWPGFIYLCRCVPDGQTLNGLQSLIEMLHLPYIETRRHLMELIFELFYLPVPDYVDDFLLALFSSHPSTMQDTWQLHDGFVANEGKAILSHIVKSRQSLLDNYLAILLYAFIYYGVLDGLVSVIIVPNSVHNSVRATILLGELLHLCSQLLPPEIAQRCHSLPKLVDAATSMNSSVEQRNTALSAISNLHRMHVLKKYPVVPCSLYLDQLLQFCNPKARRPFYSTSKSKHRQYLRKEHDDETILASIKDTQVLIRDHWNWDWSMIDSILQWPGDALRRFEDSIHRNFIKKLINFYKPRSKPSFSQIDSSDESGRDLCVVGCHLIDFLVEAEEPKSTEFLEEFLVEVGQCFSEIAVENAPSNATLSPTRMFSTLSHAYFLFIGRLSSSKRGTVALEKKGIFQYLLDLISLSSHEAYMKLIVSSLDYTIEGHFTRTLLAKILTATSESARLYATNYVRVLLRAKVKDFSKWALELLAQQLSDKSSAVVIAAAEIIDESLDNDENLESLISLRPSLLHIGDRGVLLNVRYFSSYNGFKACSDSNYLNYEIDRWKKTFNLKYARIVEDVLNESLTYHQRSEDGTYGRRTDRKNCTKNATFIPPHLYGQLAKHEQGLQLLIKEDILPPLYQLVREADFSNEFKLVELKSALWAIGHVSSSSLGFEMVKESEIIPFIVGLAAHAPILSLRGIAYFVLGLIGSTTDGADHLKDFGWETMRHSHNEKWPLVRKPDKDSIFLPFGRRVHTLSTSSAASRITDIVKLFSTPGKSLKSVDSFVCNDVQEDENDILYSSLPVLEAEKLFRSKREEANAQSLNPQKLSRVSSLSPQHYNTAMETRPRSSSDCQQRNFNEMNSVIDNDAGSGVSWTVGGRSNESMPHSVGSSDVDNISTRKSEKHDSGVVYDALSALASGVNPPLNAKAMSVDKMLTQSFGKRTKPFSSFGAPGPRRKISEPYGFLPFGTYHNSLNPRNERSDSNESSGKSRSGSFADSTSGVSSCDSTMTSGAIGQSYFQKLSPIASLSSISNNISNAGLRSAIFPHSTLPRKSSSVGFGSPTDDVPVSFESIPSAVDASGYATLRAIQRKRVESLGIHYQSFSTEESPQLDAIDDIFINDFHTDTASLKSSSLPYESSDQNQSCTVSTQSSDAGDEPQFMGLCLPLSLELLFVAPDDSFFHRNGFDEKPSDNLNVNIDKLPLELMPIKSGLELHSDSKCLFCYKLTQKIPSTENLTVINTSIKRSLSKRTLTVPSESEYFGTSFTSSSSVDCVSTPNIGDDSLSSHVVVRKEVLRYVTNLSGSIFAKASEQGLLNLKQKYPQAFQDICLYSEICLHLASYSFRLPARRFLQELFLDLTFDQLYSEAETIINENTSNCETAASVETSMKLDLEN